MTKLNFNYGPPSSSLLQNVNNILSSVSDQFIVRPLGSPNILGISGFIFDVVDDEEMSIESQITDHFVEDNFAIQDHIALRPIQFTVRGQVAEIVDNVTSAINSIYTQFASLASLGGIGPSFNSQDAQFYAKVNEIAQFQQNVVNQAKSIFNLFDAGDTTRTKQQKVYQYFFNMWKNRQLCVVETPFAVLENMAIERIRVVQPASTNTFSDFIITFKMIRTVSSVMLASNAGSAASSNFGSISTQPLMGGGRFEKTISAPVNLGADAGAVTDEKGNSFSVSETLKRLYVQQADEPNQY